MLLTLINPIYQRIVIIFFRLFAFFLFKQQPLDQSQTNGNGGFGLGGALPGGQLLSTALGVTRAVTAFLGTALQVQIHSSTNT